MNAAPPTTRPPSDELLRDLRLVLPPAMLGAAAPRPVPTDEALRAAARAIRASRAPAFVGLHRLTLESLRMVAALAERTRGRLLPCPSVIAPPTAVTHTATLGHVFACDLIVWVARDSYSEAHPVAQAIAQRRLLACFVDATVPTVQRLRAAFRATPSVEPFAGRHRVAVALPPRCPAAVVSQWHQFAGEAQHDLRLCVLTLPEEEACNARGVEELLTWQFGVSPSQRGGIDLAQGPRRCPTFEELNDAGALDLIVAVHDLELPSTSARVLELHAPPPTPGTAARVMRCDGVVLWLCDDPAAAPPDPTARALGRLLEEVQAR